MVTAPTLKLGAQGALPAQGRLLFRMRWSGEDRAACFQSLINTKNKPNQEIPSLFRCGFPEGSDSLGSLRNTQKVKESHRRKVKRWEGDPSPGLGRLVLGLALLEQEGDRQGRGPGRAWPRQEEGGRQDTDDRSIAYNWRTPKLGLARASLEKLRATVAEVP